MIENRSVGNNNVECRNFESHPKLQARSGPAGPCVHVDPPPLSISVSNIGGSTLRAVLAGLGRAGGQWQRARTRKPFPGRVRARENLKSLVPPHALAGPQ